MKQKKRFDRSWVGSFGRESCRFGDFGILFLRPEGEEESKARQGLGY